MLQSWQTRRGSARRFEAASGAGGGAGATGGGAAKAGEEDAKGEGAGLGSGRGVSAVAGLWGAPVVARAIASATQAALGICEPDPGGG
jgi:hypothetical protein